MTPLENVRDALREAHAALPEKKQVLDISYQPDVDPYGAEAVLVYVKVRRGSSLAPEAKREIERRLRDTLKATGYLVFFRWLTAGETNPNRPTSALH